MEEELNEQAIKLMDEIFPLGHDCAPIADENYPKRQGFVRGFKEAIKLVKNNGVLGGVKKCETKITTCPHCGDDVYYSNHKHHLYMSCS